MLWIKRTCTYTIRHEEVCTHRINVHKCLVFFLVWAHAFYGRNKLLISLVKVWERHDYGCTCMVRDREMNGGVFKSKVNTHLPTTKLLPKEKRKSHPSELARVTIPMTPI